jgi:hypothetical protein
MKQRYHLIDIKDIGYYAWVGPESPIWQYLGGGKAHFESHDGKKGYLIGDTESNTIPSMSIRELHRSGKLD